MVHIPSWTKGSTGEQEEVAGQHAQCSEQGARSHSHTLYRQAKGTRGNCSPSRVALLWNAMGTPHEKPNARARHCNNKVFPHRQRSEFRARERTLVSNPVLKTNTSPEMRANQERLGSDPVDPKPSFFSSWFGVSMRCRLPPHSVTGVWVHV